MESVRLVSGSGYSPLAPCGRCGAVGCPWDRIGSQVVCPDCQEHLVLGEGEPLAVKTAAHKLCAVCGLPGTVLYVTFPLHGRDPLEIDLCPKHFHAFVERRLDRYAYRVLSRHLTRLGLSARQIFLLHEAFYDERGRPLQPVGEE
jgi:hypothetical protein